MCQIGLTAIFDITPTHLYHREHTMTTTEKLPRASVCDEPRYIHYLELELHEGAIPTDPRYSKSRDSLIWPTGMFAILMSLACLLFSWGWVVVFLSLIPMLYDQVATRYHNKRYAELARKREQYREARLKKAKVLRQRIIKGRFSYVVHPLYPLIPIHYPILICETVRPVGTGKVLLPNVILLRWVTKPELQGAVFHDCFYDDEGIWHSGERVTMYIYPNRQ